MQALSRKSFQVSIFILHFEPLVMPQSYHNDLRSDGEIE